MWGMIYMMLLVLRKSLQKMNENLRYWKIKNVKGFQNNYDLYFSVEFFTFTCQGNLIDFSKQF